MDSTCLTIAILVLLGWGTGGFIAKLAANRIGSASVFWDLLGYAAATILYTALILKPNHVAQADRGGIILAILAGFIGSLGGVGFYLLMARKDASVVAPMTALYPALTALLAFVFLRETLTVTKVAGIILATIAMLFLSV